MFDWEWTYAAPLELLMSPPRWLCKDWPAVWSSDQRAGYSAKFEKFFRIFKEEEMKICESGPLTMSKLMEESWNRSGNFEFHQLLGEVFLFDEDCLWDKSKRPTPATQSLVDGRIIEGKMADYFSYLAMSNPMRVFDYIRASKDSARCSFCWDCLDPEWASHDISECVQMACGQSSIFVMEAAASCCAQFCYPEGLEVHPACGAPYCFGCRDKHCLYQMVAYSAYVAATGKASCLHQKARMMFSKLYNVDINKISPEELMVVMASPHQVASRNISALAWFIELIHDNAQASFQWYSQYGL